MIARILDQCSTKIIMKNFLFYFLIIFLAAIINGCGSPKTLSKATKPSVSFSLPQTSGKVFEPVHPPIAVNMIKKFEEVSRTIPGDVIIANPGEVSRTTTGKLTYQAMASLPSTTIDKYFTNGNTYVLAVFGLMKGRVVLSLLPSNSEGSRLGEPPPNLENIVSYQDALQKRLEGGIPLGLDTFPLIIKMETNNLMRIITETKCQFLAFSLGIENEKKLTICVFGSDDGRNPHRLHFNGIASVLAEETWPDKNFTYYALVRETDVVLR